MKVMISFGSVYKVRFINHNTSKQLEPILLLIIQQRSETSLYGPTNRAIPFREHRHCLIYYLCFCLDMKLTQRSLFVGLMQKIYQILILILWISYWTSKPED